MNTRTVSIFSLLRLCQNVALNQYNTTTCFCAHLCLAGRWQGQHSGLGHRQAALMIFHTMGHVCPSHTAKTLFRRLIQENPLCRKQKYEGSIQNATLFSKTTARRVAMPQYLYPNARTCIHACPYSAGPAWLVNRVLHYTSPAVYSNPSCQSQKRKQC